MHFATYLIQRKVHFVGCIKCSVIQCMIELLLLYFAVFKLIAVPLLGPRVGEQPAWPGGSGRSPGVLGPGSDWTEPLAQGQDCPLPAGPLVQGCLSTPAGGEPAETALPAAQGNSGPLSMTERVYNFKGGGIKIHCYSGH